MHKSDDYDIQTTHDLKRDLLLELKKRHFRSSPNNEIRSFETGRGPKMIRASGLERVPGKRNSLIDDIPVSAPSNKPTFADGWNAVVAKENDLNIINGNLGHTAQPTRRSLSSSSSDTSNPSSPRSRSSSHQRSPVSSRPGSALVRRTLSNTSLSSSYTTLQRKISTDSVMGSAPPLIPPPKVFLGRKASSASATSSSKAREQFTPPPPPPPLPMLFNSTCASDLILPETLADHNDRKSSSSSSSSDSNLPSPSTSVRSGINSLQDPLPPSPPPPFPPSPPPYSPDDFTSISIFPLPSPPPTFSTLPVSNNLASNPSSSSLLLHPENEMDRKSSMSPSEIMGIFDAALDDQSLSASSYYNDTPHEDHSHRFTSTTAESFDVPSSPALEMTSSDLIQSQQNTHVHTDHTLSRHEDNTKDLHFDYALNGRTSIPVHNKKDKDNEKNDDKDGARRHSYGDQGVQVEIEERSPTSKGIRRKRPQSVALMVTKLRPDVKTIRQQIKPGTVDSLASLFTNMKHQYNATSPTNEKVDFDLNLQRRLLELENFEKTSDERLGSNQTNDKQRSLSNTQSPRDNQYKSFDLPVPSINVSSINVLSVNVPSESNMMFGEVESRTSSRSNSTASDDSSGHERWRAKLKITDTNMSGTSRSSSEDSIDSVPGSRELHSGDKRSRSSSELNIGQMPPPKVKQSGGNLSRSSSDSSINQKPDITVTKSGGSLSRSSSDNSINLKSGDNLNRYSSGSDINLKTYIRADQQGDNLSVISKSSSDSDLNRNPFLHAAQSGHNLSRSSSENSIQQNHALKDKLIESKLSISSRSSSENSINLKPILQATQSEGNLPVSTTGMYASNSESNINKISTFVKLNSSPGFDFLTASREIIKQINSRNSSRNNSLRRTNYHVESPKSDDAPTHREEDANLNISSVIGSEISTNFIKPTSHRLETWGNDEISTLTVSENDSKQTEAGLHTSFSNIEQGDRLHTADSRPQSQHVLGTQDTGNYSSETRFSLPIRGHFSETMSTSTGNILEARSSVGSGMPMFSSGFVENEHVEEYSFDFVHGAKGSAYVIPLPSQDVSGEVEHTFKSPTADRIINIDSLVYNKTSSLHTDTTNDINVEGLHTEPTGLEGGEVCQDFGLSVNDPGPAHKHTRHDSSLSESDHSTSSSRSHSPPTHKGAALNSDVIMIDNQHESTSASKSRGHSISSFEKSDSGAGTLQKDDEISDLVADKAISEFQSILDFDSDKSHSSNGSSSSSDSEDDNEVTNGKEQRHSIDTKPEVLVEPPTHDETQVTGQPGLDSTQVEVVPSALFAHHISHVHQTHGRELFGGGDEGDDDRPKVKTVTSPSAQPSSQREDLHLDISSELDGETGNDSRVNTQHSDDFLSILDDIKIETDLTSNFLGKSRLSGVYSKEEKINVNNEGDEKSLRKKSDHGSGSDSSDSDSSGDDKSEKKSQSYSFILESLSSDTQIVQNKQEDIFSSHSQLTSKSSIEKSDSDDSDDKSVKKSQSYTINGESLASDTQTVDYKHEDKYHPHNQLSQKSSISRSDSEDDKSKNKSQLHTDNFERLVSDSQSIGNQEEEIFHSNFQLSTKSSIGTSDSSHSDSSHSDGSHSDGSDDEKSEKKLQSYTVNSESLISDTQTSHLKQEKFPSDKELTPKLSTAISGSSARSRSDSDSSKHDKKKESQKYKVNGERLISSTHAIIKLQEEIYPSHNQLTLKTHIAKSDSSDSDSSDDDKIEQKSCSFTIQGESVISGAHSDHTNNEEILHSHSELTPKSSSSSLNIHSLRQPSSGLDEAIRQQHRLLSLQVSDHTDKVHDSSFSDARSSRNSVSSEKSELPSTAKETSFNSNFFNLSISSEGSDEGKAKSSVEKDNEKSDESSWPVQWSSHKQISGFLKQTGNPETKKNSTSQRSSLSSSQTSLSNIHNEDIFKLNPLRSSSSSSASSADVSKASESNTEKVDKIKSEFQGQRLERVSRKSSLTQKSPVLSRLISNSSDRDEIVIAIDENELLPKSEFQKRRENFEKLRLEREKESKLKGETNQRAEGRAPLRTFGRIEDSTSFQAVKKSFVPRDYTPPAVVDINKQGPGQTAGSGDRVSVGPPQTDVRANASPNVHTSLKPRADSVDEYRSDSSTSSSDDSINSRKKTLTETKDKLSQFLRDFQKGNQKRGSGKIEVSSNPPTDSQNNETSENVLPSRTSLDSDSEDSRGLKETRRKFEDVKTEYIHKNRKLTRSTSSSSESDSSSGDKMTAIVGEVSSFGIHKEMTSHDESSTVTHAHSNEGSHLPSPHKDNNDVSDIYLFQRPQGDVYVLQEVLPNQKNLVENVNAHVLNTKDLSGAQMIFNNSSSVITNHHDGYPRSSTTDLIVDSSAIEDDAARDVIAAFLKAQELSQKRQSHATHSTAQVNHDTTVHNHSRGAGEGSHFHDNTRGLRIFNSSVDHNSTTSLPTSSPGVVVVHHKTEYTDSQTENSLVYNQSVPQNNNVYDSYYNQQAVGNISSVHDSSRIVVDNSRTWASPETDRVLNESRHENIHSNSFTLNSAAQHGNVYQVNQDEHWQQDSMGPSGFVLISPTTHSKPLMVNVSDGHSMVNPYQSTPITVTTTTQAVVGEKVDMKIEFSPPVPDPVTSSSDDESVTKRYVVRSAPQKSSLKKSSRYDSDVTDQDSEFVYNKTDTLTENVRVGGQNRDIILKAYDPDTSYTPRYVSRSESQSTNTTDGSLYQKYTRGHSPNTSYSSTYVTSPPRENQSFFITYDPHSRASRNSDTKSSSLTSARNLSRSVPESLHIIGSPRRSREPTHHEISYKVVSGSKKHHSPERFFKNPTLSLRRDEYEVKGYSSGEESEPKQYRTVTKLFLNGDKPRSPSPTNTQYKVTSLHSQDSFHKQGEEKLDNDSSFYEVRKVKSSGHSGSSSDESDPSSSFKKEKKRYRVLGRSDTALNKYGHAQTIPGFNSSHEKSFEEATITRTEQVLPSRLHSVPPSTKTHRTVIQLEVDRDKKFKEKLKTEEDFVDSRYMIKNIKSVDDFHSKNLFKDSSAAPSSETLWRTGRAKSMESLHGRLDDDDSNPRTNTGTSPRMVKTMKQKEGNRLYVINSTVSDSGGERRNHNPPGWFKSTIDINENSLETQDRNNKRSSDIFTSSQSLNNERTNANNYTTEKTVYYVREKPTTSRTRSSEFISPDSGQGTEIASSDGENDSRHKYERVERIYEVRTEPQIPEHLASTEDLHNDLRVLRGKILIQNRLDGSEHDEDDFDENANLFDSSFHLGKDNPLYSSDPDIMASLQREEQAELSRHVHQDITFETVDRIAQRYKGDKGQELSPKPKRKQNLSALLLSKLASVDSKDIRQTIDVEHHNEEIYGDIDFIHADGQRSASRNTSNFDSVNEKVELTLTQGKAYVIIKVIAERIVPTDYEFNVWRKSQAIVTRQIEIDLLANEQRRRLYQHVMESASNAGYLEESGSKRRRNPLDQADGLSPQERQLSSMETLKLFSQILDVAEGQGDIDHTNVQTKQEMGQLPGSAADLLY